ncbi:MAG: response regulator [Verrucomicrobiae bacterium]|nr:response regulator [Verrucomicrobiae bacterium]
MNILIVEDSVATRKLLATLVNSGPEKHQVFEVGSAEQALDVLGDDNAPGIDIFLIDQNLPGMDGATLARTLRDRFGATNANFPYLIMVTSDNSEATISRALEAGANDYITKPVNLKVLNIRMRVARMLAELGRFGLESEYLRSLALGAINTAVTPMSICEVHENPPILPIAFANRAMAQWLGMTQPELAGRSLAEIQMWSPEFSTSVGATLRANHFFHHPLHSLSKEWNKAAVGCTVVPLNVENGTPTHALVIQSSAA